MSLGVVDILDIRVVRAEPVCNVDNSCNSHHLMITKTVLDQLDEDGEVDRDVLLLPMPLAYR